MSIEREKMEEKQHKLLFAVRKSVRYHSLRKKFFDGLGKFITCFGLVAGMATVATLLGTVSKIVPLVLSALASVASAINLVVGCAESARRHGEFGRDFNELELEIVKAGENPTHDKLIELVSRRLEIEANEPTKLVVLDTLCHNEILRAMGYDKSHDIPTTWPQRCFAHYCDIDPEALDSPLRSLPRSEATSKDSEAFTG